MNQYRKRTWLEKEITRLRRKLLVLLRGKFRSRFPDRCSLCGKRSRGMPIGKNCEQRMEFYRFTCGHPRKEKKALPYSKRITPAKAFHPRG